MKRLFHALVTVLVFVAMAACSKAPGPADGNSVQPNNHLDSTVFMSATISGQSWTTDSAFGYYIKSSGNDSGIINLLINATQRTANGAASTISLSISNFTGPNTYPVNPPVNTFTYYLGTTRHFATSGEIIITNDTAYSLLGTFNVVADTFVISNGAFNVALP